MNILLILLIVLLIFALPTWPHARNFGYTPVGLLLVILIIALIFHLT